MAISVGKPSQTSDFRDGHFWGILPEQYIFRTMYFQNKDPFQFYKPAGWIYEPAGWIYEPAGWIYELVEI